jgi:outer membrane protein OmpA-like peptidoglycan-associated protein
MTLYIRPILMAGLFILASCSQRLYNAGQQSYENKNYVGAIKEFTKLQEKSSKFDVLAELADSYFQIKDYPNAIATYKKILDNNPSDAKALYQIATAYKFQDNCPEGLPYLDKYITSQRALGNDVFVPVNFCNQDSTEYELYQTEKLIFEEGRAYFNPVNYNNNLYFLSSASSNNQLNIFYVEDRSKSNINVIPGNVNSSLSEGPFDFDKTTETLYFTREKEVKKKRFGNKKVAPQTEILIARLIDGMWKVEEPFQYNEELASVGHPAITADGKFLVFSSDQLGSNDLYICEKQADGSWGKPLWLEDSINTPYKEIMPCFASNPNRKGFVLSFSSNRPSTVGGMDVYLVDFDGNSWGEIIHHPYPVNSTANEYGLRLFNAGGKSLVVSDRDGVQNVEELFGFNFTNRVQGVLKDENGNEISDLLITVTNVKTKEQVQVTTDKFGKYEVGVFRNQEYVITTSSEVFEPILVKLSSGQELKPVMYEMNLTAKIAEQVPLIMNNLFFVFNSDEILEANSTDLIKLLNTLTHYKDLVVRIGGHTDSKGREFYNYALSEKRALAVVNWLIGKGISIDRLRYVGYGETKLVNKCADGVTCTEEEHQANRRTTIERVDLAREKMIKKLLEKAYD